MWPQGFNKKLCGRDPQMAWRQNELTGGDSGNWGRGQFRNPEEGESPILEAATKQRQLRRVFGNYSVIVKCKR
jgi:hypothetical protein